MRSGVENNDPQQGGNALLAGLAFCLVAGIGSAALAEVQSVRGLYDSQTARFQITYGSPSRFSLGWEFQLFIDADNDAATGYWSGFDLLLRGVERADPSSPPGVPDAPDSGQVYVRAAEGGAGPGGWGRVIATAPFAMTDDQHLTFDVPLGVGSLTDGRFRFTFESYYDGRLVDGVYDSWTEASNADPPDPPFCVVSTSEWQSNPFDSANDALSARFHAIPNDDFMSGYIALSRGQPIRGSALPVLVGFDATGLIAACDANTFRADYAVPYKAGTAYHFHVDVDALSATYSVTVTPEASPSVMLANHFSFCDETSLPGRLDYRALRASSGSMQVCGFTATECLADSDEDGVVNCQDSCPNDPTRTIAGPCGCGVVELDLDGDGLADSARGDADGNGTVDLYDYEALLDCFAGPNAAPSPVAMASSKSCLMFFDYDGDEDIDADDVRQWGPCLQGP